MRQVLGPGALGKPRGSGWRWRWEGGLGWGTHVNPWLIHFNVWQNSLQIKKKIYCNLKYQEAYSLIFKKHFSLNIKKRRQINFTTKWKVKQNVSWSQNAWKRWSIENFYSLGDIKALSPTRKKPVDLCSIYSCPKYFMDEVKLRSAEHIFSLHLRYKPTYRRQERTCN